MWMIIILAHDRGLLMLTWIFVHLIKLLDFFDSTANHSR